MPIAASSAWLVRRNVASVSAANGRGVRAIASSSPVSGRGWRLGPERCHRRERDDGLAGDRADLGRGTLAALGQLAHLGGHHREAAPMLAGAAVASGGMIRAASPPAWNRSRRRRSSASVRTTVRNRSTFRRGDPVSRSMLVAPAITHDRGVGPRPSPPASVPSGGACPGKS
jgi:hypothetical protein